MGAPGLDFETRGMILIETVMILVFCFFSISLGCRILKALNKVLR